MTEPNEATTPLSRMRFSWQRGSGRPGSPAAPDEVDDRDLRDEDDWAPSPAQPGSDGQDQDDQLAEPDTWTYDELPEPTSELSNGRSTVTADPVPDQDRPEGPHGAPVRRRWRSRPRPVRSTTRLRAGESRRARLLNNQAGRRRLRRREVAPRSDRRRPGRARTRSRFRRRAAGSPADAARMSAFASR